MMAMMMVNPECLLGAHYVETMLMALDILGVIKSTLRRRLYNFFFQVAAPAAHGSSRARARATATVEATPSSITREVQEGSITIPNL